MKAVFFAINLIFGIIGVVFGVAALLTLFSTAHSHSVVIVGLGVLVMAGVCLCMCGDCLSSRRKHLA